MAYRARRAASNGQHHHNNNHHHNGNGNKHASGPPPPIRSREQARKFLHWMQQQEDKARVLNDYYEEHSWNERVRDMLQHLDEDEGARAIKQTAELLLSEELMKPCFQSQLKRMLRGLMVVEQAMHHCLQEFPQDSVLLRFLMFVASGAGDDMETAERLQRLGDRLQRRGCEFYLSAINGCIRQQLDSVELAHLPSMRHDNDELDFREIKICPTRDEVLSQAIPYLPSVKEGSEIIEDRHLAVLDAQFRLLREDFVGVLREEFRDNNRGGRRAARKFSDACIVGIECKHRPAFRVSIQLPGQRKQQPAKSESKETGQEETKEKQKDNDRKKGKGKQKEKEEKNKGKVDSERLSVRGLEPGGLVCLRFRGPGQLLFGKVEHCSFEELGRGFVDVDFGAQSIEDCLAHYRDGTVGELISVCPGYFAYEPVLRVLQTMDAPIALGDSFIDGIVQPTTCNFRRRRHPARLQAQIDGLDTRQRAAFDRALSDNLTLIQGPPGTGKTYIGSLLGQAIYHGSDCRILCVCYTNHALDQFLEGLLDAGIKDIVRIGGRCKSSKLEPYKLQEVQQRETEIAFNKSQSRRRVLLSKRRGQLKDDLEDLAEMLHRQPSGDRTGTSWPWRAVSKFLSKFYPKILGAFEVPEPDESDSDAEFAVVGHSGRAMRHDDLWQTWVKGKTLPEGFEDRSNLLVWRMSRVERQQQIREWQQEMFVRLSDDLKSKMKQFRETSKELQDLYAMRDSQLLRQHRIIGITTTGAAMKKDLLLEANIDVVLVEEASEVLEAHVFTALAPTTKHVIMIGDHEQLRPKVANYTLTEEARNGHSLNISTFERLIRNGFPFESLSQQHRMRPEISQFVRALVYPNLEDHSGGTAGRPPLRGVDRPVMFVQHNVLEDDGRSDDGASQSHSNEYEVDMIAQIVRYLAFQGYKLDDMAVLTPYLGQLVKLRATLNKAWSVVLNELDTTDLVQQNFDVRDSATSDTSSTEDGPTSPARGAQLRIATIDNFQGEEAKIVIISLVRSNRQNNIGFLGHKQRVNVLLSRARDAMILVGNASTLCNAKGPAGKMWGGIINNFNSHGYFGQGLPLKCHRHGTLTFARSPDEFPTHGGCEVVCDFPLDCGHRCPRPCHLDDVDHANVQCVVPVDGKCLFDHPWTRACHDVSSRCPTCRKLERLDKEKRDAEKKSEAARKRIAAQQEVKLQELQRKREQAAADLDIEQARQEAAQEIARMETEFEAERNRLQAEVAAEERKLRDRLKAIQQARKNLQKQIDKDKREREQHVLQQLQVESAAMQALQITAQPSDAKLAQNILAQEHQCHQCHAQCRRFQGKLCVDAEQPSNSHFLCNQCIILQVDQALQNTSLLTLEQFEQAIACTARGCQRTTYTRKDIEAHCVDDSVRQAYQSRIAELQAWQKWSPPATWACYGQVDWNSVHTQGYQEYEVPQTSAEFNDVLRRGRFADTCSGHTVTKILRIENPRLWQNYRDQYERIGRRHPRGRTSMGETEKWLWHGCRGTEPDLIKASNIDFRHSAKGFFGRGAYFAIDAVYSTRYASRPKTAPGQHTMFLCRVAVGTPQDYRGRGTDQNLVKPADGFDSVLGTVAANSDAYIVYNESQCYPEYEIWYQA